LALKVGRNSLKGTYYLSNSPQKRGLCLKVWTNKPKKPNSAQRSVSRIKLSNGKEVTVYIPGEKHNLQEYSNVLTSGRGAKDLPGVKYRVIRGWKVGRGGDAEGVKGRKQGRSLYGVKKK
jgi:small subunit ribosomal protein S12